MKKLNEQSDGQILKIEQFVKDDRSIGELLQAAVEAGLPPYCCEYQEILHRTPSHRRRAVKDYLDNFRLGLVSLAEATGYLRVVTRYE